jgi:outer membrane protein OmpA-like peptidoglycan-associated protein
VASDPAAGDPFGEAPAGDPAAGGAGAEASGSAGADFSFDEGAFADADSSLEAEADDGAVDEGSPSGLADDPGMVQGRREPMMNQPRGSVGLMHTALPEVGGDKTFRFRIHTDFFKAKKMFLNDTEAELEDTHSRMRGAVNIGFTPIEYLELWFSVQSSSNRNDRDKPGRQDPTTIFALGDSELGLKGAYRFKDGGVGLGGQMYLGLISGSGRLLTEKVNFGFDAIFGVDLRYLTEKKTPVRFAFNLGWLLDNSSNLVDWAAVSDPLSREVLRFGLGANNSRVRTRIGMDFPMRVGKNRQVGIDPMIEYSWDIATSKVEAFEELTESIGSQNLPRSTGWLSLGLRANVYAGLFLDAGVDIGTTAPDFEYGPNVPPYQINLGLGWSFDPKPIIQEVEVAPEGAELPLPEPVLDGRIVGVVSDASGSPMPGVLVRFPGRASNDMVTDANGGFTSFRFPAGEVAVQVQLPDGSVIDRSATVVAEQDTRLDIALEGAAQPAVLWSVITGTFKNEQGQGVAGSLHVTGMGVDEPFTVDANGQMAVELQAGEYSATFKAEGYADKTITIVSTGQPVSFEETVAGAAAPDTPNIKASSTSIRLRKKIRYKGDALSPKSHALLDELALFLNGSPDYKKIRIGVYTDDRGNPRKRSQARADAVKAYLVGKGVAPGRIVAKGYADSNPVAVNLTADGRAKNNRTRIRVTEYAGK